jgi:hypothetical protein
MLMRAPDSIIPVLGLSGSLRRGSYSTAVLLTLTERADTLLILFLRLARI